MSSARSASVSSLLAAFGVCVAFGCSSSSGGATGGGDAGTGSGSGGSGGGDSGAGGGDGGVSDPFVGTWQCTGMSTTMETEPQTATDTTTTMAVVTITDNGSGQDTVVRMPEGDGAAPSCTEPFTLGNGGTTLTAKGMPMCPTATSTLTETFTSVVYTIGSGGATYTTMASYSLSGINAAGMSYAATGTSMTTCTKIIQG